jgi:uncharacterized protein (DUF1697 family)
VPRYAAFLRGINLGPTRKVSGAELRSIFEQLGCDDVQTFRTSGNVIFEADREALARLTGRIEKGLESSVGFEVITFLRSAGEIQAIAEKQPFAPEVVKASKGKLQVMLLDAKPAAAKRKQALTLASDEDRLTFGDRELYWLPSGGTRDSALDLKAIEKLFAPMTQRTKGTLEQLAQKYFGG